MSLVRIWDGDWMKDKVFWNVCNCWSLHSSLLGSTCRSLISHWHKVLKVTLRTEAWSQLAASRILSHRASLASVRDTFPSSYPSPSSDTSAAGGSVADDGLQQCRLLWAHWTVLGSYWTAAQAWRWVTDLPRASLVTRHLELIKNTSPYCSKMSTMVKHFAVIDQFCAARIKPLI